ncbi:hypothetical protein [Tenacibaculum sp. 190524A05c]|uniref:Uncharacterized protein n=1 Tax=Tenacibaculum platacis TaxID=3137852 RepID=A0ABP1ET65_9FLAO
MNPTIQELGILLLKTAVLAISIFIIFKLFQLGSDAFEWILKRLPKPILILLFIVLILIWVLIKLVKFKII